MRWLYNANNGRQMNKNMAWAELSCNHRVEVHPLDYSHTRCFQCQSVQQIQQYFCGNCGKPIASGTHVCCLAANLPKCRFGGGGQNNDGGVCNSPAVWCAAGFCKKHSSDIEIRKALDHPKLRQILCADQIRTIFEFAQRNPK